MQEDDVREKEGKLDGRRLDAKYLDVLQPERPINKRALMAKQASIQ